VELQEHAAITNSIKHTVGMSVYAANAEFWHQLSESVAFDSTADSCCHSAADKIWQQSEETLPVVDC